MRATPEDITGLLKLQQADLALMKARKEFDELPQRAIIADARKKREEVLKKQEQVSQLKRRREAGISRLEDEDASLSLKQKKVQNLIDEAQGDYRNLEARTKELDGIARRRSSLEDELSEQGEELEKIEAVAKQVDKAFEVLKEREEQATQEFQKQGGALKTIIARLEVQRKDAAQQLSAELLATYDRTAAHAGGVAIGRLDGDRCGVCRMTIDEGRLVEVRHQAPLATCPHCKRLLIVG